MKLINVITLPARLFFMGYHMIYLFLKGIPQILKMAIINLMVNPYILATGKKAWIARLMVVWMTIIESLIIPLIFATLLWFVPMKSAILMRSFGGFVIFSWLLSPWFYTFHYGTLYMNKYQIWRAKVMGKHCIKK